MANDVHTELAAAALWCAPSQTGSSAFADANAGAIAVADRFKCIGSLCTQWGWYDYPGAANRRGSCGFAGARPNTVMAGARAGTPP